MNYKNNIKKETILKYFYAVAIFLQKAIRNLQGYNSFKLQNQPSWEEGFYCKVVDVGQTRKGNVATYRIIPLPEVGQYYGQDKWSIVIKLDYLPELSNELPKRDEPFKLISGKAYGKAFNCSHKFYVYFEFSSNFVYPLLICDLQLTKNRRGKYIDKAIRKAFRKVIWKCLFISHYTDKTYDMTWAGQIVRVDWINSLQQEIRFYLESDSYQIESYLILRNELKILED